MVADLLGVVADLLDEAAELVSFEGVEEVLACPRHGRARALSCATWIPSDGTIKAMLLALLCSTPEQTKLLTIDEPEQNMHPAWLKVIGRWLQTARSTEQIIVSTHSPDLLDQFTESFREGKVAQARSRAPHRRRRLPVQGA
jgi:predicted ATPase